MSSSARFKLLGNENTSEAENESVTLKGLVFGYYDTRWQVPLPRKHLLNIGRIVPWLVSAITSAALIVTLCFMPNTDCAGAFGEGLNTTETASSILPPPVRYQQVQFHGSPKFYQNGTAYQLKPNESSPWPENVLYVGSPSQEIDDAWADLLGNITFSISEEEARHSWGAERYREYEDRVMGGYTAVLDVTHTLHCVNAIRQALHPDYYSEVLMDGHVHIDHCLDYIRQSIQCQSSTILIPTKYSDRSHPRYIDSDQVHTCRDFGAVHEWNRERGVGGRLYVPRNGA